MLVRVSLLSVLALVASTPPPPEDVSPAPPPVCTVKPEADVELRYTAISVNALHCLVTDVDLKGLGDLEHHKAVYKSVCDRRQQVRGCLGDVAATAEACLTAEYRRYSAVFRELLETTLDAGCVRDGETLASMVTVYKTASRSPFESDPLLDCVTLSMGAAALLADRDIAYASRFFLMYRAQMRVRECFANIADDGDTVTNMRSLLSEITDKMRCIHPQDGSAVLCETIDVTVPDVPRLCPIRLQNEETNPLGEKLMDMLDWCLVENIDSQNGSFRDIDSLDKSRAFVRHYCGKMAIVKRCFADVVAFSAACLNESQHNLFAALNDHVRNAIHYGCPADESPLARLVLKVVSEMNRTEDNQGALRFCLDAAEDAGGRVPDSADPARMALYHRQLKAFNRCFVDKMRGDNAAVLTARTALGALQWNMKCVHPAHGHLVPCDALDVTPSMAATTTCPLVGEDADEPPEYETLVDVGAKCYQASTLDFGRLVDFSTVEEFNEFFAAFCRDRLPVRRCLDDLSSLSEVCQNRTNHQMMTIYTDFLGSLLETGCKRDGDVFATVVHGYMTSDAVAVNQMKECLETVAVHRRNSSLSVDNLSGRTLGTFRAVDGLRECFARSFADGSSFKTVFVESLNEILATVKCIHLDGSIVLCGTIVNN